MGTIIMHVEVSHPCVQHKLALIRDAETGHKKFRELASEITMFVCYEALKHLQLKQITVTTPVAPATCHVIDHDVVVVPILRAGVGMLDGILELVPTARVGFMGLYRDEETKAPVEYYRNLPPEKADALYIVVDPMLATGGSAVATLDRLKRQGVTNAIMVCIVTCPEGIRAVEESHPDVPVYAAAVDERLNEKKYIVPGLGDAGDRLFGTL
jgi:uracil phosphoribosyltransferase